MSGTQDPKGEGVGIANKSPGAHVALMMGYYKLRLWEVSGPHEPLGNQPLPGLVVICLHNIFIYFTFHVQQRGWCSCCYDNQY